MHLKKALSASLFAAALLLGSSGLAGNNDTVVHLETEKKSAAVASMASSFDGQTATSGLSESDPLRISDTGVYLLFLNKLANCPKEPLNSGTTVTWATAYYQLTDDIDLSLTTSIISPIFNEDVINNPTAYNLKLDGCNHIIKNISLKTDSIKYSNDALLAGSGVFAAFRGTLKNITFEYSYYDVAFSGLNEGFATSIGGVAGLTLQSTLNNVHVTYNCHVTVNANNESHLSRTYYYFGGLVGFAGIQTNIINCSVTSKAHSLSIKSNAIQGYFGTLCGALKQSTIFNSFAYINRASLQSSYTGSSETYLGLTCGLVHNSIVKCVYSYCGSKEYVNDSSSSRGRVSYLGIIFGNLSTFENVYIYDLTGKDASGNAIAEYVLFSDLSGTIGHPVTLDNPIPYDTSIACKANHGFVATSDETLTEGKTYYTRTSVSTYPAVDEIDYAYTEVTSPTVENLNNYYESKSETVNKFTSFTTPFDFDGEGTLRTLTAALTSISNTTPHVEYVHQGVASTGTLNEWYYSATSNDGVPYMPARYKDRVFSISYNGWKKDRSDNEYAINDAAKPESYVYGTGVDELPSIVLKKGYIFKGWYDNQSLAGKALTSIAADRIGDVTLYASFEKEPVTIPTTIWIVIGVLGAAIIGGGIFTGLKIKKYKNTYHKAKKKNTNSPF